jgi:hypothetical protein
MSLSASGKRLAGFQGDGFFDERSHEHEVVVGASPVIGRGGGGGGFEPDVGDGLAVPAVRLEVFSNSDAETSNGELFG